MLILICSLGAVLPLAAGLTLHHQHPPKPSSLASRWGHAGDKVASKSAIHKGHPAAFVTMLGKKDTAHEASSLKAVDPGITAGNKSQYAHVSQQQFDALRVHQSLFEKKRGADVPRVAFTALEDVFGSEYVGPIGVGTLTLPASCSETVSVLDVDGSAENTDAACTQMRQQQSLKAVFDTGSTNLWMASDLCESPCKDSGRHWYDHTTSRTYTAPEEKYLRINFGTASLEGPMARDHFYIGPFVVKDQDFGMIQKAGGNTFSQMPLEGIVGLAFPAMSASKGGRLPFFDNVIKQGLLEHNEFSFYFSSNHLQGGNAILWGGVDQRAYDGDIRMFNVSQPFYWAIDLYAFQIGDTKMNLQSASLQEKTPSRGGETYEPIAASTMPKLILDTGTTYFTAETTLYDAIREKLPSAPCSQTANYPNIVYTLRDASNQLYELSIPPTEYMVSHSGTVCRLAFMELSVNERFGPAMLLGEVFMRSYFTVFDRGDGEPGNARVGFGKAKASGELNAMFAPGASGILSQQQEPEA